MNIQEKYVNMSNLKLDNMMEFERTRENHINKLADLLSKRNIVSSENVSDKLLIETLKGTNTAISTRELAHGSILLIAKLPRGCEPMLNVSRFNSNGRETALVEILGQQKSHTSFENQLRIDLRLTSLTEKNRVHYPEVEDGLLTIEFS